MSAFTDAVQREYESYEDGGIEERYIEAARQHRLVDDGVLEIDDPATVVSMGADNGAYVMAWLWVDNDDIGLEDDE